MPRSSARRSALIRSRPWGVETATAQSESDRARAAIAHIEHAVRIHGKGHDLPVHMLVETHGALREVWQIAALPGVDGEALFALAGASAPLDETFGALVGGVLTLFFGGWHVIKRQREKIAIPYGVAIAAAVLWVIASFYLPATTFAGLAG